MRFKQLFLIPVLMAGIVVSSCADGADDSLVIRSTEDLQGRTVATIGGSVQDLLLTDMCKGGTVLRVETEADLYALVSTGKACACLNSSLSWSMAKNDFPQIVSVGEGIAPKPVGFGFSKSNGELRARMNEFLKEYTSENDIMALTDEWANPDSPRRMPNPDEVQNPAGTLVFAVSPIAPPFNFVKNGEISGVEAEILAKFAIHENMRWEFMNVAFSGIIACVQSGKADIGAAIMCITPERQQSIDFSDAWLEEFSLLLVNKQYAPAEAAGDSEEENVSFFQGLKESLKKSLVTEDRYKMLLEGLEATVVIAILAALFGTLLGILLCMTSMHRNRILSKSSNVFIEFMRSMPQVVFLMIMFYIVFGSSDIDGQWVAVIAFSLCFGAYTSVIFRTAVQSIDKGQTEAALSMGFGRFNAFWHIILPQTIQRALPVYKGEFIGLVKATSIVGYIAVFDLTKAGDIIRSRTYEAFFPLILVTILYFLIIWALSAGLKYIEAKTQPTRKKFFK